MCPYLSSTAANVMYECCERLSLEMSGLAVLQAKAKCYLACITALHCVPESSAWISVPTSRNSEVVTTAIFLYSTLYMYNISYCIIAVLHLFRLMGAEGHQRGQTKEAVRIGDKYRLEC